MAGAVVETGPVTERRQWPMAVAAAGLTVTTPIAVWWLIGDQTEIPPEMDPDYVVRPVDLDPVVEQAVGTGFTLAVGVTLGLVTWATLRRRDLRPWWSVLLPVLVAGYLAGAAWRAVTTGVIGANIGAGLMVGLGAPAAGALLLWAVVRGVDLLRHHG